MSASLDRQIQEFQFRIQQKLRLQDQEVNRLATHLVNLKSKIIEQQKRNAKLDDQIEQAREYQESQIQKRSIMRKSEKSRINVLHFQQVQQLQQQQAAEVEQLQKEFQECLDKVGVQSKEKSSEENAAIENELENSRELLESLKEALEEAKSQREDASSGTFEQVAEIDKGVIDELRETLSIRTEDRMRNLRSSKAKLQQCISLIEDLDRKQELAIQQRRQKKADYDRHYEETMLRMSQEREAQRADEQQRLREVNIRNKKLQRAHKRLESDHLANLRQTASQVDAVRGAGGLRMPGDLTSDTTKDKLRLLDTLQAKKKLMKQAEKALFAAREENDDLKSEIGRLKHIIRFG